MSTAGVDLAVAYSGGRDSTALLHATLLAARDAGLQVHALHVHHGLSAHADEWLAHCTSQCERWHRAGLPVTLHHERLSLKPRRGQSVEALARDARYAALARMAHAAGATIVLLAHHRRDQAETFLLQALRGAGAEGQAAMPRGVERDGISWLRPWLEQPREAIEAYLRRRRLRFIDDDSNDDPRFARNRLRLEVWPALVAAFPQAEASLADAARRAQQTIDATKAAAAAEPMPERLDIAAWARRPPSESRLLLRHWLKARLGRAPSAALVERLCGEIGVGRDPARWPVGAGDARELRRYRGELRLEVVPLAKPPAVEATLGLHRAGRFPVPGWGGTLVATRVKQGGIATEQLAALSLRARSGGEQFQLGPQRPPRSLKKQYQALGVPEWQRDGPLLYAADGALLMVPGLGVDARAQAAPGVAQLALRWEPGAQEPRQPPQ
ncbi:tRNA lysidine(34) synthetase TilS [Rivibacter subsaxonicus]|nr:tRNA lysidine(34) synthetase TilS [Rivibacter subsaxonicus]